MTGFFKDNSHTPEKSIPVTQGIQRSLTHKLSQFNKKLEENYPKTSDLYQMGKKIVAEASGLIKTLKHNPKELEKLVSSLDLAINVLNHLNNSKNTTCIIALEKYAIHDLAEKDNHWEKYAGDLSMLAGAALLELANVSAAFGGRSNLKPETVVPSTTLFHHPHVSHTSYPIHQTRTHSHVHTPKSI